MQNSYHEHGVRFQYPSHWELTERQSPNEVTITVSSPETSFWSLVMFFDRPSPENLIESAIGAFREEYDEIDVYPAEAMLCARTNVARDVEFVCLDLINSAFVRAFQTSLFSALILYQGTDCELEESKEILESISASLHCDGDAAIFESSR